MKFLKKIYFTLFLGKRFYRALTAIILLFVISYGFHFLFYAAQMLLSLFLLACLFDYIILFSKTNPVLAKRILPDRFSNGEENEIDWEIENRYDFTASLFLIDEFPENWQVRDFRQYLSLQSGMKNKISFHYRPTQRGEYFFGDFHLFIGSPMRLIMRRKTFSAAGPVKVFPAFKKLRQFEFMAHITDAGNVGYKQVRKTGHSMEFEQIREFVYGDDIRSINWKATGRTGGQLMINSHSDEKSQQVFCIIDKGRTMKMAFGGLSLLDHAVNATLAMSTVAISRQDKAGFISFAEKGGDFLPANCRSAQMAGITRMLYNLNTRFLESDFAFLHNLIKTKITQRSLLILFTNFESLTSLVRQLPYLRNIAKKHLLLVVFFENTSLQALASGQALTVERLYEKVIAEKYIMEKKLIVRELQRYGIASLLTAPEKLSVDVVNQYLQIKARREI